MAEQESVYLFSTTALTNGSADPAINFAEGQLPGTVNNSVRALMAALARYVKDTDGSLTTAGSANAYTLTINGRQTPLATGHILTFKASFSNTAAATIAVTNADAVALGTKAIRAPGDVALSSGHMVLGGVYTCRYDTAANSAAGAWILLNPTVTVSSLAIREVLVADRTYFVRTDGSNSNTGLANTSGAAFLTIQKAVDTIYALDLAGFNATISVASGTYTGATVLTGLVPGQTKNCVFSITGDVVTPTNVVISTTSADAFTISNGATVTVSGFKVQTTTSGNSFTTQYASFLTLGVMNYGACAGYQISTSYGSFTFITSRAYTISGSAVAHYYTVLNSEMLSISNTVTLTGTPAFSLAILVGAVSSYSHVVGTTFSGSATGARFYLYMNAVFSDAAANAPTFLPGNAVGTTFGGAQYNNDEGYYGWANYTPTVSVGSGTTATAAGKYKVHGRDLYLHLQVTCTASGTATAAAVPFPTVNDQYSLMTVTAGVAAQAMACLDRTALSAGLAFVDSGNTSVTLIPPGSAFTNGHVYLISGVIALT